MSALTSRLPTRASVRSTVSGAGLGTWPRMRADRGLLAALSGVVAIAAVLAVAVPRLLTVTFDEGARRVVAAAGRDGELAIRYPVVTGSVDGPAAARRVPVPASELVDDAVSARRNLPPGIVEHAGTTRLVLTGPILITRETAERGGAWKPTTARVSLTLGVPLGDADQKVTPGPAVRYVAGDAPTDTRDPERPGPIRIALSTAAAERLDLDPGSRLRVDTPLKHSLDLRVTGIYEPVDGRDDAWQDLPGGAAPEGGEAVVAVFGLLDPSGIPRTELALGPEPMSAFIRQSLDASALTAAKADRLGAAATELIRDPSALLDNRQGLDVESSIDFLFREYARASAAVGAELSLVLVGVVGAASVVMLLGAGLLVARRRAALAVEHARGASTASIGFRLLLESLLLTVVACGIGAAVGVALVPAGSGSWLPLAVVAAVSLLATPVLGAGTARRAWARRRTPANRRARGRLATAARARRLVLEGTVIALAAAAVVALRNRRLVSPQPGSSTSPGGRDVDLLLAAAPLLLALAVTVVVLHLYAYPLRVVAALARRGRGSVLHLAVSRAQQALSTLPLLALTVSFALVVMAGLVRGTLSGGQELASWERVLTDARLTAPSGAPAVTAEQVTRIAAAPGVRRAVPASVLTGVQLRIGSAYDRIDVVAVDGDGFDALLAETPLGYRGEMTRLGAAGPDGALPVVVRGPVAERLRAQESRIFVGNTYVQIRPVAQASVTSAGWKPGPAVFVDRAALLDAVAEAAARGDAAAGRSAPAAGDGNTPPEDAIAARTTVWASGPGAGAAVEAAALDGQDVVTRIGWLADHRATGLAGDLLRLLWLAVAAVGALAGVALVETVLSGARERGRTLSLVRTLGFTTRQTRGLAFGELVPLVLTGVVAGTLAGVGTVALVGPALGLVVMTGGVDDPPLAFDPPFAAAVAGCAVLLLGLAVLAETAARRRSRLAEVLRVGESR